MNKVSEQLVLDLNAQEQLGFVEGIANADAVRAIKSENKLIIIGETRSGKTQMARSSAHLILKSVEEIDAYLANGLAQNIAIDNAELFIKNAQTAVFHLYNFQQESQKALALFSSQALRDWGIDLPDLKSRLETFSQVGIDAPDDIMVVQILAKLFHMRGIIVSHDLVEYVAKRVERSYVAIEKAVIGIDKLAGQKDKVTKKLAKQYFESADE